MAKKRIDFRFSAVVTDPAVMTLCLQEVDRRLFQEKVLRAESDFHERELLRIQKERELNDIRRQHEKEIYLLRKKMHETSPQQQTATGSDGSAEPQVREVPTPRTNVHISEWGYGLFLPTILRVSQLYLNRGVSRWVSRLHIN